MRWTPANLMAVCMVMLLLLVSCSTEKSESLDGGDTDSPDGDIDQDDVEEEFAEDGDSEMAQESDIDPPFDIADVTFPYCEVDSAAVDRIWDEMSLRDRIGQHFLAGADRDGDGMTSKTRTFLEDYKIGGVFIGPPGGIVIGDPLKTAAFVHLLKKTGFDASGVPLFVSLDQEGGPNAVINSLTGGTDTIGAMPIGATEDPWVAFEQFDIMAREIRALGFTMNFGPVFDTLLSTRNGNCNTRPMSPDGELNARLGVAAMAGLQKNLILPTAKHFPGDGILDGNTHSTFVIVEKDRDFLESTILKPFRQTISAGLDGIMTIPQAYTALDPERGAITSRAINTDLLRTDMGFSGIIVTDSLGMKGAEIGLEDDESPAIEALKAGADILLFASIDQEKMERLFNGIEEALASGAYSEQEFETSTKRILSYKQKYCLFKSPINPDPDAPDEILSNLAQPEDIAVSAAHAERAVVELENNGILPLSDQRILYVGPGTVFQDAGSTWLNIVDQTFGEAMISAGGQVGEITYTFIPDPTMMLEQVIAKDGQYDVLILGTLQGRFSIEQQQMVEWILQLVETPVVHVCLGVPFDYYQTKGRVDAAIALSASRSVMVEAGAKFLFGQIPARGVMQFDMSGDETDGDVDDLPDGDSEDSGNRCVEQSIDCSGWGECVDTVTAFGCICYPNWHPSEDGLDCLPDGSDR